MVVDSGNRGLVAVTPVPGKTLRKFLYIWLNIWPLKDNGVMKKCLHDSLGTILNKPT